MGDRQERVSDDRRSTLEEKKRELARLRENRQSLSRLSNVNGNPILNGK